MLIQTQWKDKSVLVLRSNDSSADREKIAMRRGDSSQQIRLLTIFASIGALGLTASCSPLYSGRNGSSKAAIVQVRTHYNNEPEPPTESTLGTWKLVEASAFIPGSNPSRLGAIRAYLPQQGGEFYFYLSQSGGSSLLARRHEDTEDRHSRLQFFEARENRRVVKFPMTAAWNISNPNHSEKQFDRAFGIDTVNSYQYQVSNGHLTLTEEMRPGHGEDSRIQFIFEKSTLNASLHLDKKSSLLNYWKLENFKCLDTNKTSSNNGENLQTPITIDTEIRTDQPGPPIPENQFTVLKVLRAYSSVMFSKNNFTATFHYGSFESPTSKSYSMNINRSIGGITHVFFTQFSEETKSEVDNTNMWQLTKLAATIANDITTHLKQQFSTLYRVGHPEPTIYLYSVTRKLTESTTSNEVSNKLSLTLLSVDHPMCRGKPGLFEFYSDSISSSTTCPSCGGPSL